MVNVNNSCFQSLSKSSCHSEKSFIYKAKKVAAKNCINSRIVSTDANVSSDTTAINRVHPIKEIRSEKLNMFSFSSVRGRRKLKVYVRLGWETWPRAYESAQRGGGKNCCL